MRCMDLKELFIFTFFLPSFSGIKKKCNEHDMNSQVFDEETMHKLSGSFFLSFIDFSICHSLRACTDFEVNETAGDRKKNGKAFVGNGIKKQLESLPKKIKLQNLC